LEPRSKRNKLEKWQSVTAVDNDEVEEVNDEYPEDTSSDEDYDPSEESSDKDY
jgi:hypothetical protein